MSGRLAFAEILNYPTLTFLGVADWWYFTSL
jgi:hypothetical protein